jgi:anthranilate synthase component 1
MSELSILETINKSDVQDLYMFAREMPADLETPVSAFIKLQNYGARVLLESVESATTLGRYSFIGVRPNANITIDANNLIVDINNQKRLFPIDAEKSPMVLLKNIMRNFRIVTNKPFPPLLGGIAGYIGYDFVRFFESIPDSSDDELNLPLASLYLLDTLLVFDHVQRRIHVMCISPDSDGVEAKRRMDEIADLLRSPLVLPTRQSSQRSTNDLKSNFTKEEFCRAVLDVKEHIIAGDVYQLVLSQRMSGSTEADPFTVYRALRMLNPSPYMFYLDFEDTRLIGSSPEALVRLENGIATVRPIAGTRPRGENDEEDEALSRELLADEKELAEHVMLVDLGRNDLGRCCEFGSVKVTDFMKIEKYSHVMHITSNVEGKMNSDLDQFDLFRATFPAGTVTGAPKIKSMQLIEGLENLKRGPYAGAAGYFSLSGDMDWCISIRTIIMKDKKFFLQAGAGIVADSQPENEYAETKDKIAALKKAIEIAEEGL